MFARLNSSPHHSTLLEFRAGKMNMIGRTVYPDIRKGLVYLVETDDRLIHFCWKDRISGVTEDDLIIFPDDFEFKHVKQCTTGRVYVLKSTTTPLRKFFWLQEPKPDRDNEFCNRVNEIMNGSPFLRNPNPNFNQGDLNFVLNNMTPQQLLNLFTQLGRIGPPNSNVDQTLSIQSTNSSKRELPIPATTDSSSWPSTTSKPSTGSTSNASSNESRRSLNFGKKKKNSVKRSLDKVIEINDSEAVEYFGNINLSMILNNSDTVQKILSIPNIERLKEYLPKLGEYDSIDIKQQIKNTLFSPQYQQTVKEFSLLLETGKLEPILKEFNLDPSIIKTLATGNIELFIKALETKDGNFQNF